MKKRNSIGFLSFLVFFVALLGSLFSQQITGNLTPQWVSEGTTYYSGAVVFGHNPDVDTGTDPEDVWETGANMTLFADDFLVDIVSTSTADDFGSTGAITVQIFGMDSSYVRVNETLTMNGTGDVVSTQAFRVVYKAVVLTAGTGLTNAGVITIEDQSNVVMATIAIGAAESHNGIYAIAHTEDAFLYSWGISTLTPVVDLEAELYVLNVDGGVWNRIDILHFRVDGEASPVRNYSLLPVKISGKALIRIAVTTDTDNADVTGFYTVHHKVVR